MLNVFKSNKMENLMDALTSVLSRPLDNPMMSEWLGIQSRGMKQRICMHMAEDFNICANMLFLFPRQMVEQILLNFIPLKDQKESLNEDFIFWSVMGLINDNQSFKQLSSIENYIKDDETGKKLYQLSMKIARVFDDYQIYRPHMLMDWQKHNSNEALKDPSARWQAKLWNQVVSSAAQNHLASAAHLFLKDFSVENMKRQNLPQRMSLFGISALPEMFMQVFEKVSYILDINLFLLVPSNQFFFDIKSAKQLGKIALNQETGIDSESSLYYEMTNPLLSSMGTAGKDFFSFLETFDYHEPLDDLFNDPVDSSYTMLSLLQSDIFNLVHRKKGQDKVAVAVAKTDRSVSIHACHSPMREAQVLKDLLLNEFEKDPDLAPHDIIVMLPDIEVYASFIESVFTLENPLPFSVSDRRKRSESESLDAFLKITALKNSRLEQKQVLDLLLSDSIAQKFKITFDEISMIEKMAEDSRILWGRDADYRESLGLPPFEENTWQFGLQRLFMGMAMPENYQIPVQGIMGCESFQGLDLEVLGKFARFCDSLFSSLETLDNQKTVEKWCEVLKKLSDSLIARNQKNGEDLAFLFQTIDQISESCQKAEFKGTVSFDVIFSVLEQKLDQNISQGNFLAGNITFCNIMPMRSIPYKIVVLMGMDEKSFPRQVFNPGFDLIKKYPKPGDKIKRDEDRYLFLEALLSARKKMIITYTGMSIQDNSIIPCSGVVSELADTMEESFNFPEKGYRYYFYHFLHPFNREYFIQGNAFYSFSNDNCQIAKVLYEKNPDKPCFIQKCLTQKDENLPLTINLDEVIRFFKNPVEYFIKEKLSIEKPRLEEQNMDREAFSLSGLDLYFLGNFLVEQQAKSRQTDFYPVLKAMGSLPFGEKGRLEYKNLQKSVLPVIAAARKIAEEKQLPPVALEADIDNLIVSANFSNITEKGIYYLSYGRLNGARLLSAWIRHLFFNLYASEHYPGQTFCIGRDPKNKKPVLTHLFPALGLKAGSYFKDLIQIFSRARQKPFYFFCETSWQFVQALSKENLDAGRPELDHDLVFKAMNRVKTNWYGGFAQSGEKENPYISLCVENSDPFENIETLFSSGFVENSIAVYKPLLDNLDSRA